MESMNKLNIDVGKSEINYSQAEYDNFLVREVYSNGAINGEYHLRSLKKHNQKFLVDFLSKNLKWVDILLPDPENVLKLDFPICIIRQCSRDRFIIQLDSVDSLLTQYLKDRVNN